MGKVETGQERKEESFEISFRMEIKLRGGSAKRIQEDITRESADSQSRIVPDTT
jgi:hypothetical protein